MAIKALWVSRHPAGDDEMRELTVALGEPVLFLKNVGEHVRMIADVVRQAQECGATVLIVTLPFDLQARLLRMKDASMRMLRPVYRHRDERGVNGWWEFQGYEEVLEARTRTRRLGTWAK